MGYMGIFLFLPKAIFFYLLKGDYIPGKDTCHLVLPNLGTSGSPATSASW